MIYLITIICSCHSYLKALDTFNKSVLSEFRQHYRHPETHPDPADNINPLLRELTTLLEKCGMDDPLARIHVTTDPVEGLSVFLFVFTMAYITKLEYDKRFGTLTRKKPNYPLDGYVLIVGLVTLLRQFHPVYTSQYLKLLGQYVRVSIESKPELTPDVLALTRFVRNLCSLLRIRKEMVDTIVPLHLVPTSSKR